MHAAPASSCLFTRQIRLLQPFLATWMRRGHHLLHIQCGTGQFLPLLWQAGFDVIGTEHHPPLRQIAQRRFGTHLEITAAPPTDLPFEEGRFDYALLSNIPKAEDEAAACIEEALRVSTSGLLLMFWNSWSLDACGIRCKMLLRKKQPPYSRYYHPWWRYWLLLKKLSPEASLSMGSILNTPVCLWRKEFSLMHCSSHILPLPFGAYMALRLDRKPLFFSPSTPLYLVPPQFDASPSSVKCATSLRHKNNL